MWTYVRRQRADNENTLCGKFERSRHHIGANQSKIFMNIRNEGNNATTTAKVCCNTYISHTYTHTRARTRVADFY